MEALSLVLMSIDLLGSLNFSTVFFLNSRLLDIESSFSVK